ncbi:MAG: Mu-like prophage major head subunit gpT family protein [Phycisphaerales bacterium]|nr:Mu-like prophage major head subunit gpT family protein [Phycisphaerales bacterium]
MIINTGLVAAGLKSEFFDRFASQQTFFQDLCTEIASTKDKENYKWLGSLPRMREWGTGRLAKGLRTESYDVDNHMYESTIEVDRDEISDDQTGQIRIRVGELAVRAATHKDFLVSDLLKNGETSGFNSFDGVSFFNDAHASGASGNQDNKLGAAAVAPTAPTTAEFKLALNAAIGALLSFKDDVGDPLSITATGLVTVVPPSMYLTALEAVSATLVSSTSNVLQGAARVIAFPWLAGAPTKFYLLKVDGVIRPLIFQSREPVEFGALAEGSSEEFLREKYYYGVRARYNVTYGHPLYALVTTFA